MAPPWGTYDLPGGHTTTYGGSFMPWTVAIPVRGVKPKEQHPWKVEARFTSRSTAQESYQLTAGGGPQPSCKPVRAYQPCEPCPAGSVAPQPGAVTCALSEAVSAARWMHSPRP